MLFNRLAAANKPKLSLSIKHLPLEQVTVYKYLGFKLDDRLDLKQLNEVIRTVQNKVYLLNKIRPSITARTALTIYKCKIQPYLDYADTLYNEIDKTQRNKITDPSKQMH